MKTFRLFLSGLLFLSAIAAQAQFNYVIYNGSAIITGYTGFGGAVSIPSVLGGYPVTEIQGPGFENRGITSVAIPDSVTNIQAQEFAPNTSLSSFTVDSNNPAYSSAGGVLFDKSGAALVEYPPGVSGSYAIPGTVTSIGNSAFAACYYLSGVTIPNSVTQIGAIGFGYCFGLTNISIPSSVAGIGPDTFINCYNLPAITVAAANPAYESVGGVLFDKVGTTLMAFPTGLGGGYTIPMGVTTIGTNAFILCNGLTNVTIPASVTTLADGAFADCSGLTRVTLGSGVNNMATTAFAGCGRLTSIDVDPANAIFSSLNGVVFNKNQTTLVRFPTGFGGSYTTPGTVTSIAAYAFQDCDLANVTITGSVASIGFYAFQGCGSITNVTMAQGVGSIGEFAFGDCPNLATVTIPATVSALPFGAFAYCALTGAYFGGNAPTSDPQAFLGDSGTLYYLPGTSGWTSTFDGLATMIQGAPNPNGALRVTIAPAGAVVSGAQWQVDGGLLQSGGATVVGLTVGQHTVSFTTVNRWMTPSNQTLTVTANATNSATGTYLQEASPASDFTFVTNEGSVTITGYVGPGGPVDVPPTITGLPVGAIAQQAFAYIGTITSMTIPDSVTNLGEYAFNSCEAMATATISSGVTSLGQGTFQNCGSLGSVTFRGPLASIGDYAFTSCGGLSGFTIPGTVTNVGQYAFYAAGLTNITIPAAVTSIGEAAFLFCFQLPAIGVDPANPAYTNVGGVLFNKDSTELVEYPDGNPATAYTIPSTVATIGDLAFEDCTLGSVTIPTSVKVIGSYSFENCSFLTGIIIPGSVTSIGNDAFALCSGLSAVNIPASVTMLGAVPFANCGNMTAITVDAGNPAFSGVNGILYNKAGTTLVEFPGGVHGNFAIPDGIGDIGPQAFGGCQLTSVAIPESVTNLEIDAFFNSTALAAVTMVNGLASIGDGAFEDSYALTNFTIPTTVTNIGFAAFLGCSALTKAVIPASVTSMADYTFAYCGNLVTAYFEGDAPPGDYSAFSGDNAARVYYVPARLGWGTTFGGAPTVPVPTIANAVRSGANVELNAINGQAGSVYIVLTMTSLGAPLNQWTPVATNAPVADGDFSVTLASGGATLPGRFYILRIQ